MSSSVAGAASVLRLRFAKRGELILEVGLRHGRRRQYLHTYPYRGTTGGHLGHSQRERRPHRQVDGHEQLRFQARCQGRSKVSNQRQPRCRLEAHAKSPLATHGAIGMDDQRERRGRLLLLGKGAVLAHRSARPLSAESDEYEQQPMHDTGRDARCSFDKRASSPSGRSRLLGRNSRRRRRRVRTRLNGDASAAAQRDPCQTPTSDVARTARSHAHVRIRMQPTRRESQIWA
jgi:hypothetical protein